MSPCDPTLFATSVPILGSLAYRATPIGLVLSCWKRDGRRFVISDEWKILTPCVVNGYRFVTLREHGTATQVYVHRLILECFVGPPPHPKAECRHLDGDKSNNNISNLAWGTSTDNKRDMLRHGRAPRGTRQGQSKLTEPDVLEIRRLLKAGMRHGEIASRFGIHKANVSKIALGTTWGWL